MPKKRVSSLRCPTCRQLVLRQDPEFPFCSERCRLIDLGKWASGGYVVSTPTDRGDESGDADYTTDERIRRVRPTHPGTPNTRAGDPANGHDKESSK